MRQHEYGVQCRPNGPGLLEICLERRKIARQPLFGIGCEPDPVPRNKQEKAQREQRVALKLKLGSVLAMKDIFVQPKLLEAIAVCCFI